MITGSEASSVKQPLEQLCISLAAALNTICNTKPCWTFS